MESIMEINYGQSWAPSRIMERRFKSHPGNFEPLWEKPNYGKKGGRKRMSNLDPFFIHNSVGNHRHLRPCFMEFDWGGTGDWLQHSSPTIFFGFMVWFHGMTGSNGESESGSAVAVNPAEMFVLLKWGQHAINYIMIYYVYIYTHTYNWWPSGGFLWDQFADFLGNFR